MLRTSTGGSLENVIKRDGSGVSARRLNYLSRLRTVAAGDNSETN